MKKYPRLFNIRSGTSFIDLSKRSIGKRLNLNSVFIELKALASWPWCILLKLFFLQRGEAHCLRKGRRNRMGRHRQKKTGRGGLFDPDDMEEDEECDSGEEKDIKKERKKATDETKCKKCDKSSNPEVVSELGFFPHALIGVTFEEYRTSASFVLAAYDCIKF